jgi:hypothetical protein
MAGVRGRLANRALDERDVMSVAEGASGRECRTSEGEEARGADEEEQDNPVPERLERRGR